MNRLADLTERISLQQGGLNYYTKPTGIVDYTTGRVVSVPEFKILKEIPNGIKEVITLSSDSRKKAITKGNSSALETLLLPPNEIYNDIIPEEGAQVMKQVDSLALKQFVQQFYQQYMAPVGTKEIQNRLGRVSGTVSNIHLLYPEGVKSLIASDERGSWRTSINFAFKIDSGLKDGKGNNITDTFSSLNFPPYINHETYNLNENISLRSMEGDDEEEQAKRIKESVYDMNNLLYKRNVGTYRFPAFKQVNDNIQLLQHFLTRCFGIESTYLNEWDLSVYMQEGLCSFTTMTDNEGNEKKVPSFVTTLTYGLLEDVPVKSLHDIGAKKRSDVPSSVDLAEASTFAAVNMAVSTRYGIDDEPLGQKANTLQYEISKFPLSTFWYPPESGNIDDDLNVAQYIDNMFGYAQIGYAYTDGAETQSGLSSKSFGIAERFRGSDLSRSTKNPLDVIHFNDDRQALIAGWNSTDENGSKYVSLGDMTNDSENSNAYSYLPYWKLFYSSEEDGMNDLDLYHQELVATGKPASIINVAFQVVNIITAGNQTFNDVCEAARVNTPIKNFNGIKADTTPFQYDLPGNTENSYSDFSFKVKGVKITIPGSKLLNMFLKRNSVSSKAQAAADSINNPGASDNSTGSGNYSPLGALKNVNPTTKSPDTKIVYDENGNPQEVNEYYADNDDDFSNKKVVGDGVMEDNPFLNGGPHGKYLDPHTLEGYCQVHNELLSNVPTMDVPSVFKGRMEVESKNWAGLLTKNFKLNGTYIDQVVACTPNERELITEDVSKGDGDNSKFLGVKGGFEPYTIRTIIYNSQWFLNLAFRDNDMTRTIRIFKHRIRLPRLPYFKLIRYHQGRWRKRITWGWHIYNFYYPTYHSRWVTEKVDTYMTDWKDCRFNLLPVPEWWKGGVAPTKSEMESHFEHDRGRLNLLAEKYESKEVPLGGKNPKRDPNTGEILTYKPAKIGTCIKWMVVPGDVNAGPLCGTWTGDFRHWVSYNMANTRWWNDLKAFYSTGVQESVATIPITNKGDNNDVLAIVSGIIRIETFQMPRWHYTLVKHTRKHPYLVGRWCWRHYHYWTEVWYTWEWVVDWGDCYGLFFYPNKVNYVLPTKSLMEKELKANTTRDKNSSNIIDRWATGTPSGVGGFEHIGQKDPNSPQLFPFTREFGKKYGVRNFLIPGWRSDNHYNTYGDIGVLTASGFMYTDAIKSYRELGYVRTTEAIAPWYMHRNLDHTTGWTSSGGGDPFSNLMRRFRLGGFNGCGNVGWSSNSGWLGSCGRRFSFSDLNQVERKFSILECYS